MPWWLYNIQRSWLSCEWILANIFWWPTVFKWMTFEDSTSSETINISILNLILNWLFPPVSYLISFGLHHMFHVKFIRFQNVRGPCTPHFRRHYCLFPSKVCTALYFQPDESIYGYLINVDRIEWFGGFWTILITNCTEDCFHIYLAGVRTLKGVQQYCGDYRHCCMVSSPSNTSLHTILRRNQPDYTWLAQFAEGSFDVTFCSPLWICISLGQQY